MEGTLSLQAVLGEPPARVLPHGLGPRGLATSGASPSFDFRVLERELVWAEGVERLYEQAKERQWNATEDIPWPLARGVPEPLERALCTVLTWMVQQEFAAWYVPAKFLPHIHPAYLEPALFLSTQVVDEARHVEAFTKRLFLNGVGFVGSYPATEASLRGLLEQDEFDKASFLLHVLGEGTFLDLFDFLQKVAPDEASRTLFVRSHEDEARHVAYGVGRLRVQLARDPRAADRFVAALEERLSFAQEVSGLPEAVLEALAVLAGRADRGPAFGRGVARVAEFRAQMSENRVRRLISCGLEEAVARHIDQLHVRATGSAM